jgi:transcriptional regulator with XRE-family HTH domain
VDSAAPKRGTRKRKAQTRRQPPPQLLELPRRLVQAREIAGIDQKEWARRSGVSASVISRLENGRRLGNVSARILIDLAVAAGVSVGWLVASEERARVTRIPTFIDPHLPQSEQARLLRELANELDRPDGGSDKG